MIIDNQVKSYFWSLLLLFDIANLLFSSIWSTDEQYFSYNAEIPNQVFETS